MKQQARIAFAAACAAAFAAFADYPAADMININISNDSDCRMTGTGETDTLAGTLPDNAWQNTSNADRTGVRYSGDARNGYRNGVAAWDGANQCVVELPGVVLTWAVEGSGTANYGNLSTRTPAFRQAWLARASGAGEFTSVVVQNIPYEKYDVIVYVSGNASATDVRAVLVNGIPYKGDDTAENHTRVASSRSSTWGSVGSDTLALGGNALKIAGLTGPDLQVSMYNATTWGICAVQIVRDMSVPAGNAQQAPGRVLSVNLQSAKNTSGYTDGDIGLARVPAGAWTADGLALANNNANYDSDVNVQIKEWNGANGETTDVAGAVLHEKVGNAYFYGASSYVPSPQVLSGYADDSTRPEITLSGVPYRKYDVIVYAATDTADRQFGPVTVNGVPYRWDAAQGKTVAVEGGVETSTAATRWGYSLSRVFAYGSNALRIEGLTEPTLTIKGANNANNARGGIAGFQVVDMYDPSEAETREVEAGGTLEISAPVEGILRVTCPGDLTVAGAGGYTVTADDIARLDLDDVSGTTTLGANVCYALGPDRTLPAGLAFGEGSAVSIAETVEEYAKDLFSVTGLTGVSSVVLSRPDGTVAALAVSGGAASRGDGTDVKVTGVAALYDFTFTNTLATAAGSRAQATMNYDSAPAYHESSDGTGVGAGANPYQNINAIASWGEFSAALAATMPSESKKILISFGDTASGKALFLATGDREDEVLVVYGGLSGTVETLTSMTVPHSATSRHVYSFDFSDSATKLTIRLDGTKWKTVEKAGGFRLGTSGHAGVQIGSAYGGTPSGFSRAGDGVFYTLLIYDYALSEAQTAAVCGMYPYSPAGGAYSRTVSGAAALSAADSWTRAGDAAPQYALPGEGSAAALTADGATVLDVNASVTVESLTIGGEGPLTLAAAGGTLACSGLTTISAPVTIVAGAAEISGAPVVIGEGGSLAFDCSGFMLDGFTEDGALVPLTGEIDEQPEGVVTCILPAGRAARLNTAAFAYTNGCYQLVVSLDHPPSEIRLDAGATVLDDDTQGTRVEDNTRRYVAPGDTVSFSAADSITANRTYPVAGYSFGALSASVAIDVPAGAAVTNGQSFSGSSGKVVKTGAGELVLSAGNNASLDVRAGTLKLGYRGGNYSFWNAASGIPAVQVAGGATFDLDGAQGYKADITLASGATWANTGSALGYGIAQARSLALAGDASVRADSTFGILANGWGATTLSLGANTLSKTGGDRFILCNCTVSGSGTVNVSEGELYVCRNVSAPDATFSVADGATLTVREGSFACAALAGQGTVDIGSFRPERALAFAPGSSLRLAVVLASSTEEQVRIPYTGEPREVAVFEPDGTASSVATVGYEDGFIVIDVAVASLRYANPAKDNDASNFTFAFRGAAGDAWENTANWNEVRANRWGSYTNSLAPALQGSNPSGWSPVAVDGELMSGEGRSAAAGTLEGWTLRVGVFNGASVSIETVRKLQGGCWFMVDATSKLTLGRNSRAGTNGDNVDFYIAAAEGLVFTSDFDFTGCAAVNYSLSGEGSVVFRSGATKGSHTLKRVLNVPVGEPGGARRRGVITKKLIALSPEAQNVTFNIPADLAVTSATEGVAMERVTKNLTGSGSDAVGEYTITQEADGVYLRYIGFSENAVSPGMYIRIR